MPRNDEGLEEAIRNKADREALGRRGISTLDALWREIGKDQDQGIDSLCQPAATPPGIDRSALVRGLMDSAVHEAGAKGSPWLSRHAPDLLMLTAVVLLAGLVAWAVPRAGSAGIALRDLRTGERVSTDALHGADPRQVADRRLTRDVAEGEYVDPAWLAPVPSLEEKRLRGRYRMTLRIGAEDLRLLPSLPGIASLAVASKGETPQALLLANVPVLSAERSGETVTLDAALSETELRSLLPLLPQAEIRVVRRVP